MGSGTFTAEVYRIARRSPPPANDIRSSGSRRMRPASRARPSAGAERHALAVFLTRAGFARPGGWRLVDRVIVVPVPDTNLG